MAGSVTLAAWGLIRAMADVVTSGRRVQPVRWRLPGRGLPPGGAQRLGHDQDRVILCLMTGTQIGWIGPLVFTAISQVALAANYSESLTWASRPTADRDGWIAALVVFAVGLIASTVRGPRVRQLHPADGQRFRADPRPPTTPAPTPLAPQAPTLP